MKLAGIAYLIAGPLLLVSAAGYAYAQIVLKPKYDADLDDYYHELEDQSPALAKYEKWTRTCLTGVVVSVLLLFAASFVF